MKQKLPSWVTPVLSDSDNPKLSLFEVLPGNEDIVRSWVAMLGCFRDTDSVPGCVAWYHPDTVSKHGWVLMYDDRGMLLDVDALPHRGRHSGPSENEP